MTALMFFGLAEAAFLGLAVIAFVWQLDKNAELRAATIRAKRGEPVMLPVAICKPAAWRRRENN